MRLQLRCSKSRPPDAASESVARIATVRSYQSREFHSGSPRASDGTSDKSGQGVTRGRMVGRRRSKASPEYLARRAFAPCRDTGASRSLPGRLAGRRSVAEAAAVARHESTHARGADRCSEEALSPRSRPPGGLDLRLGARHTRGPRGGAALKARVPLGPSSRLRGWPEFRPGDPSSGRPLATREAFRRRPN